MSSLNTLICGNTLKKIIAVGILLILVCWQIYFLLQPINLATADLGRHIKNGELVLTGQLRVLRTNYYSYTEPDFPFINHHWLSGVIFFCLWRLGGFLGLSWFYILSICLAGAIFFSIANRQSGFKTAACVSFLLIPLIASRTDVRPEVFTYLYSGVFLFVLTKWQDGVLKNDHWLWLLPGLMMVWVNSHIGFVLGIFILGVFWVNALIFYYIKRGKKFMSDALAIAKARLKKISWVLTATVLAASINPAGLKGAIYPFLIFRNYGYDIVEHKSIWFLEHYGLTDPNYFLIKLAIVVLLLSFMLLLFLNRWKISLVYFVLATVFGVMACLAVKNFTHFALIVLPVMAFNFRHVFVGISAKFGRYCANLAATVFLIIALSFVFIYNIERLSEKASAAKLGLSPGVNLSAEFFKTHHLSGPIFNNYDLGSYLIFYLYPQAPIFVDNRPEAYPASFLKQIYIPMQDDEVVWQAQLAKYNFQTIFFYYHDITPWAQKFLIRRIDDPVWAPIFVDSYNIIFIKNTAANQNLIKHYRIPREYFSVKN